MLGEYINAQRNPTNNGPLHCTCSGAGGSVGGERRSTEGSYEGEMSKTNIENKRQKSQNISQLYDNYEFPLKFFPSKNRSVL